MRKSEKTHGLRQRHMNGNNEQKRRKIMTIIMIILVKTIVF